MGKIEFSHNVKNQTRAALCTWSARPLNLLRHYLLTNMVPLHEYAPVDNYERSLEGSLKRHAAVLFPGGKYRSPFTDDEISAIRREELSVFDLSMRAREEFAASFNTLQLQRYELGFVANFVPDALKKLREELRGSPAVPIIPTR